MGYGLLLDVVTGLAKVVNPSSESEAAMPIKCVECGHALP
jgi:hypothetical protein